MFTTLISTAVLALASSAAAGPIAARSSISLGSSGGSVVSSLGASPISFSGWHGISSLDGFDDFFGSDNFCGSSNVQTIDTTQTVVCETQNIEFIQQQISVLVEYMKRLVTTQICEVETQSIVVSQFQSSISSFSSDLSRSSSRHIGYDSSIASHISSLVDSSDNISLHDFGFHGSDIGSSLVVPSGCNWVDGSSQLSVSQAFTAAQIASLQSTSSSFSNSQSNFNNFGSFGSPVSVGSF